MEIGPSTPEDWLSRPQFSKVLRRAESVKTDPPVRLGRLLWLAAVRQGAFENCRQDPPRGETTHHFSASDIRRGSVSCARSPERLLLRDLDAVDKQIA